MFAQRPAPYSPPYSPLLRLTVTQSGTARATKRLHAFARSPKARKGNCRALSFWLYSDEPFESAHNKAPSQVKALNEANEKRGKK